MEDLKEQKKKREAKLEDTNDDGGEKDKKSKEKIPRKPNHHDQAEDKDVNNNADECKPVHVFISFLHHYCLPRAFCTFSLLTPHRCMHMPH